MIPHHRQAVQIAELATDEAASSQEVLDLAEEICSAQQPEIDTMSGWLEEWGEPVPDALGGMDHGSGGMGEMPGSVRWRCRQPITAAVTAQAHASPDGATSHVCADIGGAQSGSLSWQGRCCESGR